jgi:hypothetical protein
MALTREELETGGAAKSPVKNRKHGIRSKLRSDPRDQIKTALPSVHARSRALSVAPKAKKSLGHQIAESLETFAPAMGKFLEQKDEADEKRGARAAVAGGERSELNAAARRGFDKFTGRKLAVDVDSRVANRLAENPNAKFGEVFKEEFAKTFGPDVKDISDDVRNAAADFLGKTTPARMADHDRAQFEKRRKGEFLELTSTTGRQLASLRDTGQDTPQAVLAADHAFLDHALDRGYDIDAINKMRIDYISQQSIERKDPEYIIRHFSERDPNGFRLIDGIYGESIRDRSREIGRLVDNESTQDKNNRLWAVEQSYMPAVENGTFNATMAAEAVGRGLERGTVRSMRAKALDNREKVETLNGDMAALVALEGYRIPTKARRDSAIEGVLKNKQHLLESDNPAEVDTFIDEYVQLSVGNNAVHSMVKRKLDQGAAAGPNNRRVFNEGFAMFQRIHQANPEVARQSMEKSSFDTYRNYGDLVNMGHDPNAALENMQTAQERLDDVRLDFKIFTDEGLQGPMAQTAYRRAKLLIASMASEDQAIESAIASTKRDFTEVHDGVGWVPAKALPPGWTPETDEFMVNEWLPAFMAERGIVGDPDDFYFSGTEHSERDGTLGLWNAETGYRIESNVPTNAIWSAYKSKLFRENKERHEEARIRLHKRGAEEARMWALKKWSAEGNRSLGRIAPMPEDYLGGPDAWADGLRKGQLEDKAAHTESLKHQDDIFDL